jgi:hypothetical protein
MSSKLRLYIMHAAPSQTDVQTLILPVKSAGTGDIIEECTYHWGFGAEVP